MFIIHRNFFGTDATGNVNSEVIQRINVYKPCEVHSCFGEITLSLDENCERHITADLLVTTQEFPASLYSIKLFYGNRIPIPNLILERKHIGQDIYAEIKFLKENCEQICETKINLVEFEQLSIEGTFSKTVYCGDDLLELDPTSDDYPFKPSGYVSCQGEFEGPFFVGDQVEVFECDPGTQDTAKIIYREWAISGADGGYLNDFDTIIVFHLPPITPDNFMCDMDDTIYCGEQPRFGPFLLVPDICPEDGESICDTLYLLDEKGDPLENRFECNLSLNLETTELSSSNCLKITRYELEILQNCFGKMDNTCKTSSAGDIELFAGPGNTIRGICRFFIHDVDTTAPTVQCDMAGVELVEFIEVEGPIFTSFEDGNCSQGEAVLPNLIVTDNCNSAELVKVRIPGFGTYVYAYNDSTDRYVYPGKVNLPFQQTPYQLIAEAFDECGNKGTTTFYLQKTDEIDPVAVSNKKINVDLSSSKVWLPVQAFDNESWDNCGIALMLARRTDWETACINLCDSVKPHPMLASAGVMSAHLATDPHHSEVEAHYSQMIAALEVDTNRCGKLLGDAWKYALARFASLECGNGLGKQQFDSAFQTIYSNKYAGELFQLGGGWSDAVPFDCNDLCQTVSVEILVMDYWCNWSKSWTDVLVEDKSPWQPAVEITPKFKISCSTFMDDNYLLNERLISIHDIVMLAKEGSEGGLTALNDLFGGYRRAWKTESGLYVDQDGHPIDTSVTLSDSSNCTCTTEVKPLTYYDYKSHQFLTVDSTITSCYLDTISSNLSNGILEENCLENIRWTQTVIPTLDDCGNGTIRRVFRIWKDCQKMGGVPDTLLREQEIVVVPGCPIVKEAFILPRDTIIFPCVPFDDWPSSNELFGSIHPDIIGKPVLQLDQICRQAEVAYSDKIFSQEAVGGNCYVVQRTWYFSDRCQQLQSVTEWWQNMDLITDSFTQNIVLRDSIAPKCQVRFSQVENDTLLTANCSAAVWVDLSLSDSCGLVRYDYVLERIMGANSIIINTGEAVLKAKSIDTSFVVAEDLEPGQYRIRVRAFDRCGLEGYDTEIFTLISTKLSSANCVSETTINLVEIDPDNMAGPDTALAVIYAESLVVSQDLSCNDTGFVFRIEELDGIDDNNYEGDEDHLILGCGHLADTLVRVWFISMPSGNADFCDVRVKVNDHAENCVSQRLQAFSEQAMDFLPPVLHQNQPNPFKESTIIRFDLSVSGLVNLKIFDANGSIIKDVERVFGKGSHHFAIDDHEIFESGILYYRLTTQNHSATKQMIFIR